VETVSREFVEGDEEDPSFTVFLTIHLSTQTEQAWGEVFHDIVEPYLAAAAAFDHMDVVLDIE
jgi:hypothetical protein